ncbi:DUF3322 domain-containing protein [Congregicoccus parvus]|uniref:DUF3322 domain-containing protein n=1 Tax=Congregicoccus parvus TaxID=3081749 RepID=UPI003FA54879
MLDPADILAAARRKWPAALRALATGDSIFPLQIPFGRPRPTADFAALKREIEALAAADVAWTIAWETIETRRWGRQRWPMRVSFATLDDLAAALGTTRELTAVRTALAEARAVCAPLEPWLQTRAHRIPEHLDAWSSLVSVCAWFDAHPRPECFPRQVPVADIDTKFIETHTGILRELLDVVLGDRINAAGTTFAQRFHLRTEPAVVRFRFLDDTLRAAGGWPVTEATIPAHAFAALPWSIPRVLVVENRDVFLCLPPVPRTLAIFGAGKAAALLPACAWLHRADVVYWGDCDEAGYGILSALRAAFPHTRSLLMDEPAWTRWRHLAGPGRRDPAATHTHLTATEAAVLREVQHGPLLLEQERIPPAGAEAAILAAFQGLPSLGG